jgi:hypothetical protein
MEFPTAPSMLEKIAPRGAIQSAPAGPISSSYSAAETESQELAGILYFMDSPAAPQAPRG